MESSNSITYQAKHPFSGDTNASQLSFARGEIIASRANQSSANGWLWGICKGKQGWFPSSYVVQQQLQQQPTLAPHLSNMQQPGASSSRSGMGDNNMQQKMQSAVFMPSTLQQQQQRNSGGIKQLSSALNNDLLSMTSATSSQSTSGSVASFTGLQSQLQQPWNQQPQMFSQSSLAGTILSQPNAMSMQSFTGANSSSTTTAAPNTISMSDDPFAGLDLVPTPLVHTSTNSAVRHQQPVQLMPTMMASSLQRTGIGSGNSITSHTVGKTANQKPAPMMASSQRTMIGATTSLAASGTTASVSSANHHQQSSIMQESKSGSSSLMAASSQRNANAAVSSSVPSGASSQPNNPSFLKKTTIDPLSPPRAVNGSTSSSDFSRIRPTIVKVPDITSVEVSIDLSDVTATTSTSSYTRQPPSIQSEVRVSPKFVEDAINNHVAPSSSYGMEPSPANSTSLLSSSSSSSNNNDKKNKTPSIVRILQQQKQESSVAPYSYPKNGPNFFNTYEFLAGPNQPLPKRVFDPIYKTVPFWYLMNLNVYLRKLRPDQDNKEPAYHYDILIKALSFLGHVMSQSLPQKDVSAIDALMDNHMAIEASLQLIKILPRPQIVHSYAF